MADSDWANIVRAARNAMDHARPGSGAQAALPQIVELLAQLIEAITRVSQAERKALEQEITKLTKRIEALEGK
jgi:hypothetical protein